MVIDRLGKIMHCNTMMQLYKKEYRRGSLIGGTKKGIAFYCYNSIKRSTVEAHRLVKKKAFQYNDTIA